MAAAAGVLHHGQVAVLPERVRLRVVLRVVGVHVHLHGLHLRRRMVLQLAVVLLLLLLLLLLLRRPLTGQRASHLVLQVLAQGPLLRAVVVVGQALALLVPGELLIRFVRLLRLHGLPAHKQQN